MISSLRLNNDLSVSEVIELAVAAEDAGFDQLWLSNDVMLRSAPVIVGAVAASTRRIGIGIGIMNPFTVNPAEIAMIATTMQEASDGRFRLGLAAGASDFLAWLGIEQPTPLTSTRQALRSIRGLLRGQRPSEVVDGIPGWDDNAYLRFPAMDCPVYIGAMGPKMIDFAVAEADGLLALQFPPEHYAVVRQRADAVAERTGRSLSQVDIPACFWVSVDEDRDRARWALAEKLAYYGPSFSPYLLERAGLSQADFAPASTALNAGDLAAAAHLITDPMLALGIAGSIDEVAERCRTLIGFGARHLSFGPPLGPEPVKAITKLAQVVRMVTDSSEEGEEGTQ